MCNSSDCFSFASAQASSEVPTSDSAMLLPYLVEQRVWQRHLFHIVNSFIIHFLKLFPPVTPHSFYDNVNGVSPFFFLGAFLKKKKGIFAGTRKPEFLYAVLFSTLSGNIKPLTKKKKKDANGHEKPILRFSHCRITCGCC